MKHGTFMLRRGENRTRERKMKERKSGEILETRHGGKTDDSKNKKMDEFCDPYSMTRHAIFYTQALAIICSVKK